VTTDPLTVAEILRAGVVRTSMFEEIAAAQSRWETDGGAGEPVKANPDCVTSGHWFSSDV
jgi:hypothetical protein